jgi:hypothetical protein
MIRFSEPDPAGYDPQVIGIEQKQTAPKRAVAFDDYITRWLRWVNAGIAEKSIKVCFCIERMTNLQFLTTTK